MASLVPRELLQKLPQYEGLAQLVAAKSRAFCLQEAPLWEKSLVTRGYQCMLLLCAVRAGSPYHLGLLHRLQLAMVMMASELKVFLLAQVSFYRIHAPQNQQYLAQR